jgi:hypothetical protein
VHALLHGHIGQALHDNPFTLALGLEVAVVAVIDRARGPAAPSALARLTSPRAVAIIGIAAFAFAIARNIPMEPFLLIAP